MSVRQWNESLKNVVWSQGEQRPKCCYSSYSKMVWIELVAKGCVTLICVSSITAEILHKEEISEGKLGMKWSVLFLVTSFSLGQRMEKSFARIAWYLPPTGGWPVAQMASLRSLEIGMWSFQRKLQQVWAMGLKESLSSPVDLWLHMWVRQCNSRSGLWLNLGWFFTKAPSGSLQSKSIGRRSICENG